MEQYMLYIAHLMKCAILGTIPDAVPDDIDLKKLIKYAAKHSVECCIYEALSRLKIDNEAAMNELSMLCNRAVVRDTQQQYYLEKMLDAFEKNKITCILLKGTVIRDIYPVSYLRESCDIDILVCDGFECVDGVMREIGFDVEDYENDNSHHDIYMIKPYVTVEIHKRLMRKQHAWSYEFDNMPLRKIAYNDYKYIYRFSYEDFYLFMLAHMAKHVKFSGIGLKSVMDIWIYNIKCADKMDMPLLEKRIEKSELTVFNAAVKQLAEYLFEGADTTEDIKEFAEFLFLSGSYGDSQQISAYKTYERQLKNKSNLNFYFKSFFCPAISLERNYPVLKKYPWILPAVWIHRGFSLVFKRNKDMKRFIDNVENADAELGKKLYDMKERLGL